MGVGTSNLATKFGHTTMAKYSWEAVRMKDEVGFNCWSIKQNAKKKIEYSTRNT